MTTIPITLPDALAQEAAKAASLASEKIESMLRAGLRAERVERLQAACAALSAKPLPRMTPEAYLACAHITVYPCFPTPQSPGSPARRSARAPARSPPW